MKWKPLNPGGKLGCRQKRILELFPEDIPDATEIAQAYFDREEPSVLQVMDIEDAIRGHHFQAAVKRRRAKITKAAS